MKRTIEKIRNVGELKAFIQDLPNNMLIVHYEDGMEKYGYMANAFFAIDNMTAERVSTYDAFDHTPYSYERFTESETGVPCLKIC